MEKKKSMQRESGNLSTNFHHPKKTVNVNIVVEGDNQSNENSLSQSKTFATNNLSNNQKK